MYIITDYLVLESSWEEIETNLIFLYVSYNGAVNDTLVIGHVNKRIINMINITGLACKLFLFL